MKKFSLKGKSGVVGILNLGQARTVCKDMTCDKNLDSLEVHQRMKLLSKEGVEFILIREEDSDNFFVEAWFDVVLRNGIIITRNNVDLTRLFKEGKITKEQQEDLYNMEKDEVLVINGEEYTRMQ